VLRAVAADFIFNCWYLENPSNDRIRHVLKCVHYMRKAFDWKRSRIYLQEVEIQIGLSSTLYKRALLLVGCFDFRSDNQYILLRVILSSFRFAKINLFQVSLLSRLPASRPTIEPNTSTIKGHIITSRPNY
jgi:hypothetical protein